MDLINKLETEWSKNFPGDPLPSNIPREKSYNYHSLQNNIRKCEQTIENLNKKLQQEIFLRDFLQNFTEKLLHTDEKKNFITNRKKSNPTIGNLVTETVSTMVFSEEKIISKTDASTNPQTQSEQHCIVDGQISKTADIKVSIGDSNEKFPGVSSEYPIQVKKDNSILRVKTDEKIPTTGMSNQEEHLKNKFESLVEQSSNDLKLRRNPQVLHSLSPNSVYTHNQYKTNALKSTLSLKKTIPPSLPPKPKKRVQSNVISRGTTDTKTNDNDGNYQRFSDTIKINISEKANSNAAADPYAELGGQLPSDCFTIEVGKCSGFCTDIKAGLVESGAKPVKSSVKQVVAGSQPVLKPQRALTPTTTETDSLSTVLVTEILTNLVVKATSNSDDNITKQNIYSNDVEDYSCCYETPQLPVEDKERSYPESTCLLSNEPQRISSVSEQKILLDVAGQEKSLIRTKQSGGFENSPLLQHQTRTNQPSQKEIECLESNDKNKERKGNVRNTRVSLMRKEVIVRKDRGNVNEEKDINTNIKTLDSTGGSHNNNTNDTTDMSTFKKQREDIYFVSYRKLDTEFHEPSFTNTSTLPIPKRRSSFLKADHTISENLHHDTVFAEKPNAPSRNPTFKSVGNKDDPRKNLDENYGLQFDNKSKNVDTDFSIDLSSVTDTETVSVLKQEHSSSPLDVKKNVNDTENTGKFYFYLILKKVTLRRMKKKLWK